MAFSHPTLSCAKSYNGIQFPLLVQPPQSPDDIAISLQKDPNATVPYLHQHRKYIFDLLAEHGVLHFRDFAAQSTSPNDFANIVTEALELKAFPYSLGNAVRKNIVGDIVFTANEAPADRWIPFHHELAQTPRYPRYLLFYCDTPAETDGETPVVYSPVIYEELNKKFPEFMKQVENQGVVYSRTMSRHDRPHSAIGRGWAATFKADSREDAERTLRERGYTWEWKNDVENSENGVVNNNNGLSDRDAVLTEISPVLPAVLETHGKKAFFNQVFASWFGWRDELNSGENAVTLADGTPFPSDIMETLKEILSKHQVAVPWKRGDFVLIDNRIAMHARNPFTGKRVILASLAD